MSYAHTMYTYMSCIYGTIYSAHTPVLTHHTQLHFAIEPARRTLILILILIRIQYTVNNNIIHLSIYLSRSVDTDTAWEHLDNQLSPKRQPPPAPRS